MDMKCGPGLTRWFCLYFLPASGIGSYIFFTDTDTDTDTDSPGVINNLGLIWHLLKKGL